MKLVFLVALAAGLGASHPAQDKAERHLQAGLRMLAKSRFKDAAAEFKVAKAIAPDRADIVEALRKAEAGEAIPAMEPTPMPPSPGTAPSSARPLAPPDGVKANVELPLREAREAYRLSELNRARDSWNRVLLLDASNAEAKAGLKLMEGEAYAPDKDAPFDAAVKDLYEAGLREARKERLVEAKKKLEEALSLNPAQAQVKALLQSIEAGAYAQGATREAEDFLAKGEGLLAKGDYAAAGAAFKAALERHSGDARAAQGLQKVKELGLAQAETLVARAEKAGDEDALALYDQALAIDPNHAAALKARRLLENRIERARRQQGTKAQVDALYNAGVDAWASGDLARAAGLFKQVLEIAPKDKDAARALAKVESKLEGNADQASKDAKAMFEDGRALEEKGRLKDALAAYEKAAARDQSFGDARSAAERLRKEMAGN